MLQRLRGFAGFFLRTFAYSGLHREGRKIYGGVTRKITPRNPARTPKTAATPYRMPSYACGVLAESGARNPAQTPQKPRALPGPSRSMCVPAAGPPTPIGSGGRVASRAGAGMTDGRPPRMPEEVGDARPVRAVARVGCDRAGLPGRHLPARRRADGESRPAALRTGGYRKAGATSLHGTRGALPPRPLHWRLMKVGRMQQSNLHRHRHQGSYDSTGPLPEYQRREQ